MGFISRSVVWERNPQTCHPEESQAQIAFPHLINFWIPSVLIRPRETFNIGFLATVSRGLPCKESCLGEWRTAGPAAALGITNPRVALPGKVVAGIAASLRDEQRWVLATQKFGAPCWGAPRTTYCSNDPFSGSTFASSGGMTTAAATLSSSSRFSNRTP
jgi:hypothetical protein